METIREIKTLKDLIHVAWNYSGTEIDWFRLWKLIPTLEKLDEMIGMEDLKNSVVDIVLYSLSGHVNQTEDGDGFHTVISGPPGCGKTRVSTILAELFYYLGIVENKELKILKKTDFVGKYIGHTEDQTGKTLMKCLGHATIFDEAYSLGHGDTTDSFSKNAIDLINQFLSLHKRNFVFIIAGYKESLQKDFFSLNDGLSRRFAWKFEIQPYTSRDLHQIFVQRCRELHTEIEKKALSDEFFERNKDSFPYTGGDIEVFVLKCRMAYTKRTLGAKGKMILSKRDIEVGFREYERSRVVRESNVWRSIYA